MARHPVPTDREQTAQGRRVNVPPHLHLAGIPPIQHAGELFDTFMGISTMAPIFEAIEGARAGETVQFNGRDLTVEDVE